MLIYHYSYKSNMFLIKKKLNFYKVRYVAIIPWFTVLFGVIAGVVLWIAARRVLAARAALSGVSAPVSEKPAV